MNKKTMLVAAFAILAVIQWAVPSSMILRREVSLQAGKEYKLRCQPVDPYDAFRGRFVELGFGNTPVPDPGWTVESGQTAYASLKAGPDGFAIVDSLSRERPATDDYLTVTLLRDMHNVRGNASGVRVVWPFDRYYMEETASPEAERIYRQRARSSTAYITVRISRGVGVITGLYIDGVPIEELIREP